MVANKPIGVQMYAITGSSNHYVYCETRRKQFHIINYSRIIIAIIATLANSAVQIFIGLRLVLYGVRLHCLLEIHV